MERASNGGVAAGECPSSDALAAFVDGEASEGIELHIDACSSCRQIASAMVSDVDARLGETMPARPGALERGQWAASQADRYGRFELTRKLGQGAMGQVWAANDPGLGREVAIKVMALTASSLGAEGTARMRREAQAMARLAHPNVVGIYELGTEGDEVFCAMELVDGVTWRQWLEAPRSWREILEVGVAAARGIEATHEAGLLHRDVKPDNILIARDGRTLLTDFGLAKLASSEAARAEREARLAPDVSLADLTSTGALVGTPSYMAPEQLDGSPLDTRSDQFSFCVSLFEALTGERPFRAETMGQLLGALDRGASWPRGARNIPVAVRKVVLRGLSIERDDRFASMGDLIAALEWAVAAPRRRFIGAMVAVLVVVVGVVAITWPSESQVVAVRTAAQSKIGQAWNGERKAAVHDALIATGAPNADETSARVARVLDEYAQRWLEARVDAWSATHLRDEQSGELLERRLACYDRLAVQLAAFTGALTRAERATHVDQAIKAVYELAPVIDCADPLLVGYGEYDGDPRALELERKIADVEALSATGHLEEARTTALAVVADTDELGVPALSARALFALGLIQADSETPADAEATFRRTIQEAAKARDHVLVARTWHRLIMLLGSVLHRVDEALALEPASRAAIAQAGGDPMQYGMLDMALGAVQYKASNRDAAERHFRAALEAFTAARGARHASQVVALSSLAGVLTERGKLDEAEKMLLHALELGRELFGRLYIDSGFVLHNLATLNKSRKDWDATESYARKAVEVLAATAGKNNPHTAASRVVLARALQELGRLDEAAAELEIAEVSMREGLPAGHPRITRVVLERAKLAETRGDYPEAARLSGEGVAALRPVLAPDHGYLAYALAEHARMLAYQHPAESLPVYDEALVIWTADDDRNRDYDLETLEEVALAALRAGKPGAALPWFERMPEAGKALADLRRKLERARKRRR